jgi:hypothetical protein
MPVGDWSGMRSISLRSDGQHALPNLALARSPEDGLAGSGSAFDKPFTAGMRAVGSAGEGCLGYDLGVQTRATSAK